MDLPQPPSPGAVPGCRRGGATGGAHRAALAGALGLGLAAWMVGWVLLSRYYETLPPDGFKGLGFIMDLAAIVSLAALVGALAGLAMGIARSRAGAWGRRAIVATVSWTLVLCAALVVPAALLILVLAALAGPAATVVGVAVPACAVRVAIGLAHPAALPAEVRPM